MTLEVPEELKSAEALSQGGWQGRWWRKKLVVASNRPTSRLCLETDDIANN